MGTKASRLELSESESLYSKFKRRIKGKNKRKSSKPTPFSNYDVKICGKSDALVKIVSISRVGEMIPVILSPVREIISNEQQPAKKKKKKTLGFSSGQIKLKSHDAADISVKSPELEVCTGKLAPKQISREEEKDTVRKLDRRSWDRIAKLFRFPADLNYSRNHKPKVLQRPRRGHNAKDTKTSVIEQPKAQEIRQENELPDSIPKPIDQLYSKSSCTSAEVDSKSCKLLKSTDFHRKLSFHSSEPNSPFKPREIKSAPLFSPSSSSQLPRPNMAATMRNSPTPNLQTKNFAVSAPVAERKATITGSSGNVTGEGEGYGLAINLWVVIIIMGCLVVFSNRLLAVVCASVCWYLLPCLLKRNRVSTATDGFKVKRSVDPQEWRCKELNRSVSGVLPFTGMSNHRGESP